MSWHHPESTVVDHSAQNPKNEGLNPSTGTGKEKVIKIDFLIKFNHKQASEEILDLERRW